MLRLSILILLGLAWPSCATEEGAGDPLPAARGEVDERDWQSFLAAGEEAFADGRWEEALLVAESAIAAPAPAEWLGRFQVLRFHAGPAWLFNTAIRARVEIARGRYAIGEVIDAAFVIENLTGDELRIPTRSDVPAPEGAGAVEVRPMFSHGILYREYLPEYAVLSQSDSRNVILDEDVVVAARSEFRVPVGIDTSAINLGGTMLRSYTIECRLRSSRIEIGDRSFTEALRFQPATVFVHPVGADHLADDPVARARQALEKSSPAHLPLAVSYAAPSQRETLFDLFDRALSDPTTNEAMARAVMTSLLILTGDHGERGLLDREEWIDWLRRRDRG